MTGLTMVVATAEPERCRAALVLATAQAALGGRVRVYFHEAAVALLAGDAAAEVVAPGLPDRAALLALAHHGGVALIACASGLSTPELAPDRLVPGVETGGMVSLLATLGEDRLVVV